MRQKTGRVGRRRGRPPTHTESWTKVSMVIYERQVARLDRLRMLIRRRSGAALSRAAVVRGLLDALERSRTDVSDVVSEKDFTSRMAALLGGGRVIARRARKQIQKV